MLFRILRNCFIDQARRKKIVLEIPDDTIDVTPHEPWDPAALDQLRYLTALEVTRAIQGFHVLTWSDAGFGFALVSDVNWDDLRTLHDRLR